MIHVITGSLFCMLNVVCLMWSAAKGFDPICFLNLGGIIFSYLTILNGFEKIMGNNDDS